MDLKFITLSLFIFGSLNAMAADKVVTFKNPQVRGAGGTIGELRNISAKSDKNGVCKYLGAKSYVKGSAKKTRARLLYGCSVVTLDSTRFSRIDENGEVFQNFEANTFETINSRAHNYDCIEYETWSKKIHEIKCVK